MTDIVSRAKRSEMMSRIRNRDTRPELAVRSLLHRMGYRFRLHRRDLPGRPDMILPKRQIAIFVHGCFWHRHRGCKLAHMPKTQKRFWRKKFESNVKRDRRVKRELRKLGWQVVVVWECEAGTEGRLRTRLVRELTARGSNRAQTDVDRKR
jgi:DNA mismatch endonuclease (patch repair protein)